MLRVDKLTHPRGAEQVRPAEKDEAPMRAAEDIAASHCFKCWGRIGREPFYRVDDRLVHARCTKAL